MTTNNHTSLMRAAIHEAGHVVQGWVCFGAVAEHVYVYYEITSSERGYRGKTGILRGNEPDKTIREEKIKLGANFFAGWAAVEKALEEGVSDVSVDPTGIAPGKFGFSGGQGTDEGAADEFFRKSKEPNDTLDGMKTEAHDLARKQISDNFDLVVKLAEALAEAPAGTSQKRQLNHDEIKAILEDDDEDEDEDEDC